MVDVEKQELLQRRKQRRRYWLGFATASLVVGAVIIIVLVFVFKQEPTKAPTPSPTFTDIAVAEYARQLSDPTDFDDPLSPQSKALAWLETTNTVPMISEADIRQRYALAVFFFSSDGKWDAPVNEAWLQPDISVCNWFSSAGTSGICNEDGLLVVFDLNRNGITGTIPSELGHLASHLQRFDLTFNNLYGKIPAELGQLTELEILHVSSNQLSGTVPTELGLLSSIIQLYVDANPFLSGPMPSEICSLKTTSNLTKLWADCASSEDKNGVDCGCCKCCTTFPCNAAST